MHKVHETGGERRDPRFAGTKGRRANRVLVPKSRGAVAVVYTLADASEKFYTVVRLAVQKQFTPVSTI